MTFTRTLDKNNSRFWHSNWHSDGLGKDQACYIPFLLDPVWCTQSIVLTVKGGLAMIVWYLPAALSEAQGAGI